MRKNSDEWIEFEPAFIVQLCHEQLFDLTAWLGRVLSSGLCQADYPSSNPPLIMNILRVHIT